MKAMDHGYLITENELLCLLGGLGSGTTKGFPFTKSELGAEEQMSAVRSLVKKKILALDGEEYTVLEPFRSAVMGVCGSRYSLSFFSRERTPAYVCYPMENGLSAWEMKYHSDELMALCFTDAAHLISELKEDEFLPSPTEYTGKIPEGFGRQIAEQLESLAGDEETDDPICFAAKQRDLSGGGSTSLVLSCDSCGSVLTLVRGRDTVSVPYKEALFNELLETMLNGGEVKL